MTWLTLALLGGFAAAVVAVSVLGLALRRERTRTSAELSATQAESTTLRARLDELERRLEAPAPAATEFVITDVGEPETDRLPAPRVEGRLFADLVLRETVVKAAGLAHGVRRASSPENRFRMRFAYSREVKQARKRRRAELRRLRREAGLRARREDAA